MVLILNKLSVLEKLFGAVISYFVASELLPSLFD